MSDPVDFGVVQAEENEVIQERRIWLTDKTDPPDGENEESFSGTLGLALSGGGIRSATFNLGMLQAFAEQRLISNLDYLSTVSGGGYIGSWLTAWIFRDGDVTNTELFLAPDYSLNSRAVRSPPQATECNDRVPPQSRAKNSHACEPDPIKHLRASSNYLALRPGILSIDSWSMVTIYVRNVLLNALVVLPTVLTVVMGVLFFCGLYELIDHRNPPLVFWSAVVLLLMSYALQQLCLVDVLRNANEPTKGEQLAKQYEQRLSWFFYFGWRFLVVAAFLLSLDLTSNLSNFDNLIISCGKRFGVTDYLAQASILATIFGFISGIIQCIFVLGFVPLHKRLNSVIYRLCAGFVSGAMGVALLVIIRVWMTKTDVTWSSHLSLPLVLLAIFVCESARTAIICRVENPETREWTSVFQSCCLRIAFTTLVLVFLVRYLGQEVVGKQ